MVEGGGSIRPANSPTGKRGASAAVLAAAARRRGVPNRQSKVTPDDLRPLGDELRALDKIKVGDGCWEWAGAVANTGYGVASSDGQYVGAHRAVYELLVGPIPDGHHLHHKCETPLCVRPGHLAVLTPAEHSRAHARAVCQHGHRFDEENTYTPPGTNKRYCLACRRAYQRENRERLTQQKRARRAAIRAAGGRPT